MYGLLEWHGVLKVGSVSMKVSFTNGTTTAYGVAPATYITKDELTQFVIEHSEKFRKGVIKLLSKKELPGSDKNANGNDNLNHNKEQAAYAAAKPAGETAGTVAGQTDDAAAEKVITVSSKSDAVEYLKEHFKDKDYTSVKLRTKEAFEAACKECGIRFVW